MRKIWLEEYKPLCHKRTLQDALNKTARVKYRPSSKFLEQWPCTKCGSMHNRRRSNGYLHSYCLKCSATIMRGFRTRTTMTPEQRRKDICRSYSHVLLKRGHLKRAPCQNCGASTSQMHHPDYGNPRLVEWLCRGCHLALHKHG